MATEKRESIFSGFVKQMIGKCSANFQFPRLDSPLPGDEMLKPKVHVLVKIKKDGVALPSNTFECYKVVENVIGCSAYGRYDKNGSLRMMLDDQRLANKLMNSNQIKLNNATYTIEAISDKRVNQGRGIFFNKDLDNWTQEEIFHELKKSNVVDIYPLTKNQMINGEKVQVRSGAYKVTFNDATVPRELKVGPIRVSVNLYYDNPMYCRKCGQFGHTQKVCSAEKQRCLKCGKDSHETENCTDEQECVNCFQAHDLNPRSCEIYKLEQECIRYATKAQISVAQARRYATKQIFEFVTKTAEEQTLAQIVMEEKGETGEVRKEVEFPVWFNTSKYQSGSSAKNPSVKGPKPSQDKARTLGLSFWQTQVTGPAQAQERKRAAQVNPHERVKQKENQQKSNEDMEFEFSSDSEANSDMEPTVKKSKF